MLSIRIEDADSEKTMNAKPRPSEDAWTIEFKGLFTVTDRNGERFQECTENMWRFKDDNGWVVTVGIGENPRIAIAGNDRTPLSVIGEAIASTIRAMRTPPSGEATDE